MVDEVEVEVGILLPLEKRERKICSNRKQKAKKSERNSEKNGIKTTTMTSTRPWESARFVREVGFHAQKAHSLYHCLFNLQADPVAHRWTIGDRRINADISGHDQLEKDILKPAAESAAPVVHLHFIGPPFCASRKCPWIHVWLAVFSC